MTKEQKMILAMFDEIQFIMSMSNQQEDLKKDPSTPTQFEKDFRDVRMIQKFLEEDRVNGDFVKIVDPLDHKETISLNDLYMRLSNEHKLQYPAPFQEVNDIKDHVRIAEELYLELGDYLIYRQAKR